MDAITKFSTAVAEAAQHRRAADLLVREASREMWEAERLAAHAQRATNRLARGLRASGSLDWNEAQDIRDESERLAAEWSIAPRMTNGFFVEAPIFAERTITVASAGSGLVSVASPNASTAARASNSFLDLCTVQTMRGGKQLVGRFSALPTAQVLASESAQASAAGATAAQAIIGPSNIVAYEEASRQWTLATPAGADTLGTLLLNAVRTKVGQQIIEGGGTNAEILGLVNDSAVTSATGTTIAQSHVVAALEAVEKQAGDGALAWVVTAPAATILRQRAVISGGAAILADGRIGGYPVFVVGGTTNAHAVFGRWSDLLIYQWAPLELATNPFANFQAGVIGVRAWATVSATALVTGSFYCIKSLT